MVLILDPCNGMYLPEEVVCIVVNVSSTFGGRRDITHQRNSAFSRTNKQTKLAKCSDPEIRCPLVDPYPGLEYELCLLWLVVFGCRTDRNGQPVTKERSVVSFAWVGRE
jgi:hypothetical protein